MNGISALLKGPQRALSPLVPCDEPARRWPPLSQDSGSQQTLDLLVPWFRLPGLQNREISVSSHSVVS